MAQKFTIAARSPLMANILAGDTSLTVDLSKADLFPVADTGTDPIPTAGKDWFKVVLEDSSKNIEIVYVRTRALGAASMTNCLRGQEGTTARSYLAGSIVGLRHTAQDLGDAISFATSASAFWKSVIGIATAALSRVALGVSAVGDALFTAADAVEARTALGLGTAATGDIGTAVQAYDADTAKTDTAQNFTAPQRAALQTDNDLSFDLSAKQNFKSTPTAGGVLTFTGMSDGISGFVVLNNTANYAITAAATTKITASDLSKINVTGKYRLDYGSDGTDVFVTVAGPFA